MGSAEEKRLDPIAAARGVAPDPRVRQRPRMLPGGLSDRELEVLLMLARGSSNREMAEALGISVKTVGHHVQHLYGKVGARSRVAATRWAFEQGLVRTG